LSARSNPRDGATGNSSRAGERGPDGTLHGPARVFRQERHVRLLLYGVLLCCVGMASYLVGVLLGIPRHVLGIDALLPVQQFLVWYSGVPIVLGLALGLVDLLLFLERKRADRMVPMAPLANRGVTVALTAYNDELSIGDAVSDFKAHPDVRRVIVVSNDSADRTLERAAAAGAITFNEPARGYGRCVHRCLSEATKFADTDFVVLCEGDRTFRAADIDKLLAYAPHADIVNGTRTSEPLRDHATQLTTFIYYGNVFVAKLLEAKHLGRGTLTDVGTTYKLCRREVLDALLPLLNPAINLEFNAHFLDTALEMGVVLVECPITFHARVGRSRGGNTDNWRGFAVGMRMIRGIALGWKRSAR
jgi:mRNA-degrading endonuclease toxin of MazEF toxin-antitoxin module